MYNEGQSTGKFHTWASLSYVFTIISALGLVGSMIEWIMWKKNAMMTLSNAIWRMAGAHTSTTFHLVMAVLVLMFAGGVVCNIIGSRFLGRAGKGSIAASVLIAVLDAIGALFWAVVGIIVLISGFCAYDTTYKWIAILTGVFGILTLVAMAVSTIFLFLKAFGSDEMEPNVAADMIPPVMGGGIPPVGGGFTPVGGNIPPAGGVPPVMGGGIPPMGGGFTPAGPGPTQRYDEDPIPVAKKPKEPKVPMGRIKVTKGVAVGQPGYKFPETNKMIIGKSRQRCNLIVDNPHVSNIHCSVRYNAQRNVYIIKDHSSNGTYVNHVRLAKGVPTEYPAGTIVSLANNDTQITLG